MKRIIKLCSEQYKTASLNFLEKVFTERLSFPMVNGPAEERRSDTWEYLTVLWNGLQRRL